MVPLDEEVVIWASKGVLAYYIPSYVGSCGGDSMRSPTSRSLDLSRVYVVLYGVLPLGQRRANGRNSITSLPSLP